jgi:capsular polysaccharide biosynthesis protein
LARVKEDTAQENYGGRPTLASMVDFLRANWKFLALLTLVLSAVGVILALLVPGQYTKQVTLSVRPVPTELIAELDQTPLAPQQLGDTVVRYLQNGDYLGQVEATPLYNPGTQQVEIDLRSNDEEALDDVGFEVVEVVEGGLQQFFEDTLGTSLETQLAQLEVQIEDNNNTLTQLEQQIEQVSTDADDTEDSVTTTRLEALEAERADRIAALAQAEDRQSDLEQAQEDLRRLAGEAATVELVSESAVSQTGSLASRVALAVVSGFVVALLATIVRAASRRGG